MELAFATILASSEGCSRAKQWMESPGQFKREAAIRFEGVIPRGILAVAMGVLLHF